MRKSRDPLIRELILEVLNRHTGKLLSPEYVIKLARELSYEKTEAEFVPAGGSIDRRLRDLLSEGKIVSVVVKVGKRRRPRHYYGVGIELVEGPAIVMESLRRIS